MARLPPRDKQIAPVGSKLELVAETNGSLKGDRALAIVDVRAKETVEVCLTEKVCERTDTQTDSAGMEGGRRDQRRGRARRVLLADEGHRRLFAGHGCASPAVTSRDTSQHVVGVVLFDADGDIAAHSVVIALDWEDWQVSSATSSSEARLPWPIVKTLNY